MSFSLEYWVWIKSAHVIAVIAWMAGLLYLPRLFVYHAEAGPDSEAGETFKVMERRLLRGIMNPAMIATWLFGLWLAFTPGMIDWSAEYWIHGKLLLVAALTVFHLRCGRWRKDLEAGTDRRSPRFYRIANEVPAVIMAIIVILVIAKPL